MADFLANYWLLLVVFGIGVIYFLHHEGHLGKWQIPTWKNTSPAPSSGWNMPHWWATIKPWVLGLGFVIWAYFLPWKLTLSAIQGEATWREVWSAVTPITLFFGAGLIVICFWQDLKNLAVIATVVIILPWLCAWGWGYDVPIFGKRKSAEKEKVEVPSSGYWVIPTDGAIRVWLDPQTSRTYPEGRVRYTHVNTNFEFVGDPTKPRRVWPTGMPIGEYKITNLEEEENPFELKR